MESLKAILAELFRKRNLETKMNSFRTWDFWEEAVGRRIARHAQPKRIHDRVLWVAVDNSTWMQELMFQEARIRAKLNALAGGTEIEKIRFQLGEIVKIEGNGEGAGPEAAVWRTVELDPDTRENIEREVTAVPDQDVREELKKLFQKQAQLESYRGKEKIS